MRVLARFAAVCTGVAIGIGGLGALAPAAHAAEVDCSTNAAVDSASFTIHHLDGTVEGPRPTIWGVLRPGDTIVGTLHVNPLCSSVVLSAASYTAPSAVFSHENQKQQKLFNSSTGTFAGGSTATLSVTLPRYAAADTSACPNKHQGTTRSTNGNGGTTNNPYASTCDGTASANGSGDGNATGRPCAGCVGNADNKNPKGQAPNGSDHNAGYECDRNKGVGQTNPAHSGCRPDAHFQVEFVVGPVIQQFVVNGVYTPYAYDSIIHKGSELG